ncbi:SMAD/FHA domain-containing protein [Actinidia rufa]|uniref:SMAD/FHA domain-containing protein n=1 Tax=Actinidia rufa TaxID=165716 RepID=A0A7J0H7D3_9ERIC|nr:SMAD/FHA domain-containing protein [Actinidia rufa]
MTTMGPPPPRNPNAATSSDVAAEPQTKILASSSTSASDKSPMAPPPPQNPKTPQSEPVQSESHTIPIQEEVPIEIADEKSVDTKQEQRSNVAVPYIIPEWSGPPRHNFFLEVLKDGSIIDQLDVYEKGAYMFGRVDLCDFVLEHPTISRFHTVLQFKRNGDAYLYDLGSTHGTFVNKNQESDLKIIKKAKMQEEMKDMEASLLRAKLEASLADGISWGMSEDAIEEIEDDVDEISWQNYKGQLTERQEKTRDKVIKRLEKVSVFFPNTFH